MGKLGRKGSFGSKEIMRQGRNDCVKALVTPVWRSYHEEGGSPKQASLHPLALPPASKAIGVSQA